MTARGGFARTYTPSTVGKGDDRRPHPIVEFKATVRMAAQEAYKGKPLNGPLKVDLTLIFPRQKNKIWKTRPMPRYRHIIKPDRDNVEKAILDALTNAGTFVDDCQVCAGSVEKWHAAGDEQPHCEILITELGD